MRSSSLTGSPAGLSCLTLSVLGASAGAACEVAQPSDTFMHPVTGFHVAPAVPAVPSTDRAHSIFIAVLTACSRPSPAATRGTEPR